MKKLILTILSVCITFGVVTAQTFAEKGDQLFEKAEKSKTAKPDEAAGLYKQAAEKYKAARENLKYAKSMNEAGKIFAKKDKYAEALNCLKEAEKAGINNKSNEGQLALATTYITMGTVYNAQKNSSLALDYHQKALQIRIEKLGENHEETATSYGNIGNVFYGVKNYDKAILNHEKALQIREKVFGKGNKELAQSYNNLGKAYQAKKEFKKAAVCYDSTLAIRTKALGANHADVKKSYQSLSDLYMQMGDSKQAAVYKAKAGGGNTTKPVKKAGK